MPDISQLVSVIMPMYNSEKYVKKSVHSLLCQSYSNIEIIIVDDTSNDNSVKIVQSMQEKDKRIKLFRAEGKGVSAARNQGLRMACGEWIAFADSDDIMEKDGIENLLFAAVNNKCNMSMGGYNCYTYNGSVKRFSLEPEICCDIDLMRFCLTKARYMDYLWLRLFNKDVFKDFSFPEGKYFEDVATVIMLCDKAGSCAVTDKIVYNYYMRSGSICFNDDLDKQMHRLDAVKKKRNFIKNKYPELLPEVSENVLETCITLLGKLDSIGIKNVEAEFKTVCRIFRKSIALSPRRTVKLKCAVLLFQISPVLLAKLIRIYSNINSR